MLCAAADVVILPTQLSSGNRAGPRRYPRYLFGGGVQILREDAGVGILQQRHVKPLGRWRQA